MTTATVDIRAQLNLEKNDELFKYLNLLIYSQPSVGKTYLAATAQDSKEFAPVLHLGFEKGLMTVAFRENYDKKEIRTIDQLEQVVGLLQADQRSANPYYKTLIVDNGTELQNIDIETIMADAKRLARDPDKVNINVPSMREWGIIGKRLRRAIVGLRDLEMHTIWTAWEKEWKDEDTKITYYSPQLAGHVKTELAGYFDIVGHYRQRVINDKEVVRSMQVMGTDRVVAKWRNRNVDVVPTVIDSPTIPMIWDFVKQSKIASN